MNSNILSVDDLHFHSQPRWPGYRQGLALPLVVGVRLTDTSSDGFSMFSAPKYGIFTNAPYINYTTFTTALLKWLPKWKGTIEVSLARYHVTHASNSGGFTYPSRVCFDDMCELTVQNCKIMLELLQREPSQFLLSVALGPKKHKSLIQTSDLSIKVALAKSKEIQMSANKDGKGKEKSQGHTSDAAGEGSSRTHRQDDQRDDLAREQTASVSDSFQKSVIADAADLWSEDGQDDDFDDDGVFTTPSVNGETPMSDTGSDADKLKELMPKQNHPRANEESPSIKRAPSTPPPVIAKEHKSQAKRTSPTLHKTAAAPGQIFTWIGDRTRSPGSKSNASDEYEMGSPSKKGKRVASGQLQKRARRAAKPKLQLR